MKWVYYFLRKLKGFLMSCFVFNGQNVVSDLKHIDTVFAVIKGNMIEITKTDGTWETVPKTNTNIGQLVYYCIVTERNYNADLLLIEEEIPESKLVSEQRDIWRKLNNLTPSKINIKIK